MAKIELKNVTKSYDQSKRHVTALNDVTLEIPTGQLVAFGAAPARPASPSA